MPVVQQVWQRPMPGGTAGSTEAGQCVQGAGGATGAEFLTTPAAQQTSPGGSASLQIAAQGRGVLTYGAAGLPTGLSISSSTGVISGTASKAGLYTPVVWVTDPSTGYTSSCSFDWLVQ